MNKTIINSNIDETNGLDILNEIKSLTVERNKYNIHDIPSPNHLKRVDFADTKAYKRAKDVYFEAYKNTYNNINNEIKRLHSINSNLCIEIKKKEDDKAIEEGTFYNNAEQEYLAIEKEYKSEVRKSVNIKYYESNKKQLKLKALMKAHKAKIPHINLIKKEKGNVFNHLLLANEIINPMCPCGKRCDVVNFKNLQKHFKIQKHQLFKSIIKLVHYKRLKQNINIITTNINNELIYFKKVVRVKKENKSITLTNKTESEIINYYNALLDDFDENKMKLRPSSINKVKYTEKYKDKVLLLKLRTINLKRVNKV